jgi:hypothetical protein
MPRNILILLAGAAALGLTACGGSATGGAPGAGPSTTSAASASAASSSQSAAPTSLDPCQLVTSSEASALAGASFGPGREETSRGGGRQCVYGFQTTNVFTVEVGHARSSSVAQAQWAKAKAKARSVLQHKLPAGITVSVQTSNVPGLADRAATVYSNNIIAGRKFGISGIYLLKGATFLAFQDLLLGHKPPSTSALESEARTALARVP